MNEAKKDNDRYSSNGWSFADHDLEHACEEAAHAVLHPVGELDADEDRHAVALELMVRAEAVALVSRVAHEVRARFDGRPHKQVALLVFLSGVMIAVMELTVAAVLHRTATSVATVNQRTGQVIQISSNPSRMSRMARFAIDHVLGLTRAMFNDDPRLALPTSIVTPEGRARVNSRGGSA